MGKYPTGRCEFDMDTETVEDIIIQCEKQRKLKQKMRKHDKINKAFIKFLKETGLYTRIQIKQVRKILFYFVY